jgi:HSP20 family protein
MFPKWQSLQDIRSEIQRLQGEMNRAFGRFDLGDAVNALTGGSFPAVNVWETDESLFVEAELPGLDKNDVEIFVTAGNQLSIKGERKEPAATSGTWHRRERSYGKFGRVVELPYAVDADKVDATFRNGVLTLTLPKAEEAKPRKIRVKA